MRGLFCLFASIFMMLASPAFGQATRTWVSGVGDDVTDGTVQDLCRRDLENCGRR